MMAFVDILDVFDMNFDRLDRRWRRWWHRCAHWWVWHLRHSRMLPPVPVPVPQRI